MPKVHLAQVANLPLTEHTPTFPHPEFAVKQKSRRIQRTRATTILRIRYTKSPPLFQWNKLLASSWHLTRTRPCAFERAKRRCVASAGCERATSEQQASELGFQGSALKGPGKRDPKHWGETTVIDGACPMLITPAQSVHRWVPTDHDGDRRRNTPEANGAGGWQGKWLGRRTGNARMNNDRRRRPWWRRAGITSTDGVRRGRSATWAKSR